MTEYQTIAGTTPEATQQHEPRTVTRVEPSATYMMSEIGDGVFVQWSQCSRCHKRVGECTDAGGPQEPEYMKRWRTERFAKSFGDRGIAPGADPYSIARLMETVQDAQDAAYGDSNDEEIDGLRMALEEALALLGQKLPESRDPDADADDTEDLEILEQEARLDVDPSEQTVDDGLDAALERVKSEKENVDVGF